MKVLIVLRKENGEEENNFYRNSIESFGSTPVYCNTLKESKEEILKKLSTVDAVLLTGGEDELENDFLIIDYCVKNNLRLLGICLGMQEMAIYDSNYKTIEIGNLRHKVKEDKYIHPVNLKVSKLSKILGTNTIKVNTHHRMTVSGVEHFNIVGYSDDNIIEAIEGEGDFQIGVQWHPERMLSFDDNSKKLFKEFLKVK